MLTRRKALIFVASAAGAAAMTRMATAADYPSRPLRLIVPYAAGGSTDLTGRLLAKEAAKHLNQSIVVENRPGAAAMLGMNETVQARPDGYTIGMVNSGMVTQPIFGTARFDYPKELTPIAQIGEIPFVFAVRADAPWKTMKDVIEYARANPDALKYGITGFGNTAHIGPEHLSLLAKIKMEPVNFDGGAPLIAALLGGHIQGAGNNPVDLKEHVKAGRIRLLVVFGEKRLQDPMYADVPTATELGYPVVSQLWQGVAAPKKIPAEVRNRLNDAFAEMMKDPEVRKQVQELGLEPAYLGPDDFEKRWLSDQEHLRKVVTDTGILDIVKNQTR